MKYILGIILFNFVFITFTVQGASTGCVVKFPCSQGKECCGCNCPTITSIPTVIPNSTITPTPEVTPPTPTLGKPQGGIDGNGGGTVGPPSCDNLAPGTSKLISVIPNGKSGAELKWTPAGLATHYSISYGLESNKYLYGVNNTGNVTSFLISALNPSQNYCFTILPVNGCKPGSYSNEICTKLGPSGGLVLGSGEVLGLSFTGSSNHYIYYLVLAVLGLSGLKLVKDNA